MCPRFELPRLYFPNVPKRAILEGISLRELVRLRFCVKLRFHFNSPLGDQGEIAQHESRQVLSRSIVVNFTTVLLSSSNWELEPWHGGSTCLKWSQSCNEPKDVPVWFSLLHRWNSFYFISSLSQRVNFMLAAPCFTFSRTTWFINNPFNSNNGKGRFNKFSHINFGFHDIIQ